MKKRAVFLDRDGTVNRTYIRGGKSSPPLELSEIEILDGVVEGLEILRGMGLELVIVTNQPDFKRGVVSARKLMNVNEAICGRLGIEHSYMCLHDTQDGCDCRKPKNGLIVQAASEIEINLTESYLIGDRVTDIQAGYDSGCTCFYIRINSYERDARAKTVSSLLQAARIIAGRE